MIAPTRASRALAVTATAVIAAGCTSALPREVVDARTAYRQASQGPAARYAPRALERAKESLDRAERAYEIVPDAQVTRDLAYVATRNAQVAHVFAQQQVELMNKSHVESEYANAETRLKEARRAERARIVAAAASKEALAKLATVKNDERGTIITLSDDLLFAPGQTILLPDAQSRLAEVATALRADQQRPILLEEHTDSIGSPSFNADISQRRAETIRKFLFARGFHRVEARGLGMDRPIADNASSSGRANNRRLEIIVQTKKGGE